MSVVDTTYAREHREHREGSTPGGRDLPWLPDPEAGQGDDPALQRPLAATGPQPHRDEPAGGDRGTGNRAASQARASDGAREVDAQPQQQPPGGAGVGGGARSPGWSRRAPGGDGTRERDAAPRRPRMGAGPAASPIVGGRGAGRPRSREGGVVTGLTPFFRRLVVTTT